MKAKFIGDPSQFEETKNLPEMHIAFGTAFPRGKFVDVPDKFAARLANNNHYETQGDAPEQNDGMAKLTDDLARAVNGLPADPTK